MQRGGSTKEIGPLVPDITGPEKLDELCEFNLIAAHGLTNRKRIMIVPENTFILFMGPAGDSVGSRDIVEGLITQGGNSGDKRASYMQGMFNTFVEGSDDLLRPYSDSFVYTPGDMLYDTKIIMNPSIGMDSLFRVGMYELPVKEIDEFGQGAARYAVPVMIKAIQADPALKDEIEAALDPTVKDAWDDIYAARTDAEILAKYMEAGDKDEKFRDIHQIFTDTSIPYEKIIKPYMDDRKYGNKLGMADIPLSRILHKHKSSKRYRFIIIATCRTPDIKVEYENAARMHMRRMSFSAKDIYCSYNPPSKAMNLRILKDTVEYELREPLFLDKSLGLKDHLRKFLIYMRDTFFNVSGSNATVVLRYKPTIKTADFLLCIAATNINRINSIKYHTYIHIIYQFNSIIQAYVEGTVKDLIAPTRKKFYERVLDLLHTATRKNVPKFEGGGKGRRLLRRRVTRRRRLY